MKKFLPLTICVQEAASSRVDMSYKDHEIDDTYICKGLQIKTETFPDKCVFAFLLVYDYKIYPKIYEG
jgi:hypothetical protein